MTAISLHSKTNEIWELMLEDIRNAQTSIELEQYSFWDDSAGHKFLVLLEQKHWQGVRVRIICDGWGSYPLFRSGYAKKLQVQGIEILSYNPVGLFRPSSWFYHMHKKTLVVDSKISWIGGLGIKKKFFRFRDAMLRFDDTSIAADIQNCFEVLRQDIRRGLYFKASAFEKQSSRTQLLVNHPGYGPKEIYEQMRQNIQAAQKSIYLTTSYFFPDRNFFQLILDKANQGLDIKIILRGKDDELIPVRFSTSYFHKALIAGIGIYRYEPAIIHTKTAVVDGKWATVGSSNLDKFSFYYNMEANVASTDPELVNLVSENFLANLADCRKIEQSDWAKRPFFERVLEFLIWPIHNYL
jgi:cardiolipin synthase